MITSYFIKSVAHFVSPFIACGNSLIGSANFLFAFNAFGIFPRQLRCHFHTSNNACGIWQSIGFANFISHHNCLWQFHRIFMILPLAMFVLVYLHLMEWLVCVIVFGTKKGIGFANYSILFSFILIMNFVHHLVAFYFLVYVIPFTGIGFANFNWQFCNHKYLGLCTY